MKRLAFLVILTATVALATAQTRPETTTLRFEVTLAKGLVADAQDGRLLVILGQGRGSVPAVSRQLRRHRRRHAPGL